MTPYYQDSAVTIYHGDCREIVPTLGRFDLVVTSPPYDNLRTYGDCEWNWEIFTQVAKPLAEGLSDGGVIVWNVADATIDGSETGTSFRQALHFKEIGLNLHDTMIWSKCGFTAVGSVSSRYGPVFEYMFILSKGMVATFNPIKDRRNKTAGRKGHGTIRQADGSFRNGSNAGKVSEDFGIRFNIWEIPNPGVAGNEHPATFPIQIAADHITSWSKHSATVLDPFAGSGTTGRACKDLGRKCVLIEREEKYCEIAARRMAQEVLNFT